MVRKRFVVGGNGRRSGLAITTRGAMELRILVVPKLWEAAGDTASGPLDGNAAVEVGRSLTIVVSEGTEFVLRYSGESPLAADLSACLEDLVKVAKRRDADHSRNGTDEVDAGTRRAPLIDRSQRQGKAARINLSFSDEQVPPTVLDLMQTPMRRRRQRRPPRVVRQNAEFFADYWESFQAFWLQSRAGVQDIDLQALGRMSARETARFELRLLVYLAFVRAVTDLLRHVRPAYQRVTQRSSFIRGRMSVASAALVAAGGATHVTCTYDEFGIDSPLLRVIVSALETVSDTKKGEFTARQSMDPAAEAGWLRRQFEGVASLSLAAAARVGAGLQGSLSRLDSDWQVALDLACLVLEDRALSAASGPSATPLSWEGTEGDRAFVFDIKTDVCWERLVRSFWEVDKPGGRQSWEWLGKGKAPDGLLVGKPCVTLDAKYKWLDSTPSADDQHQAFVYSHLFQSDVALLIYPATEPAHETGDVRWRRRRGGGCKLGTIHMAFPQPTDLKTGETWDNFHAQRSQLRDRVLRALEPE